MPTISASLSIPVSRIVLAGLLLLVSSGPGLAATCGSLALAVLPATNLETVQELPAGSFVLQPGGPPLAAAICRVAGVVAPAIRFEVWLPLETWNGRLLVVGNSRMGGAVNTPALASAVLRGYAAASTDTGHASGATDTFDASWALGRPDLVADFGYRAVHVTTVNAKALVTAFYERPQDRAYFSGCSKGGQQGLMAAQRYPGDFDGIVAGAPAHDWTRFYAGGHLWYARAVHGEAASVIPPAKLVALDRAVTLACDGLDGLADGLLDDPRSCRFDAAELACAPGEDAPGCLTQAQVRAVQDVWGGARTSSGELLFPGLMPGGASAAGGWESWVTGVARFGGAHFAAADGFFKYVVYQDPAWDFRTFDYDRDVYRAMAQVGPLLDASSPDLREFAARGGKLLVYHGWADADISPLSSTAYYDRVAAFTTGSQGQGQGRATPGTDTFFRLFMVPGMGHCGGGPGFNAFDTQGAIERWVEAGDAPASIRVGRVVDGVIERTRPVCAYPRVAGWDGTGDPRRAESFSCRP